MSMHEVRKSIGRRVLDIVIGIIGLIVCGAGAVLLVGVAAWLVWLLGAGWRTGIVQRVLTNSSPLKENNGFWVGFAYGFFAFPVVILMFQVAKRIIKKREERREQKRLMEWYESRKRKSNDAKTEPAPDTGGTRRSY
jgi:phosphotransferase system  glucose/maltose/N-acetylglucosamine-specific IIC component